MKLTKKLAAIAALACAAAAGQAQANVYVITTIGHVIEGTDPNGVFGSPTIDLTGVAYKAVYTVTDPLPGAYFYDDGTRYYLEGGSFNGTPSPVSAKITINGTTKSISGNFGGSVLKQKNYGSSEDYFLSLYSEEESIYPSGWKNMTIEDHTLSSSLGYYWQNAGSYFSHVLTDTDQHSGFLSFSSYDYPSGTYPYLGYGAFQADRITIASSSDSIIPEPATWALMILGFGAIGAAMRRKPGSPLPKPTPSA